VLRLSLECGEVDEPMPLDVVVTDHEAQQLAHGLAAGQRIWATGSLKAVQRGSVAGASRIQIEVMASAVAPHRLDAADSDNESGKEADSNTGRALFPAKV
jgi:hypothetical protein